MREPYYKLDSLNAENSVGYLVKRCGVLMTQVAEQRFESLDISFTEWQALVCLAQQQHISATELSAQIGHDMGALTRVVDSLERRGLARRQRSRRDRRAVEIAITPAGRRQALSAKRVLLELLNRLVGPFSHHEIDTLISLLQRLLLHLQEAVGPKPAAAFAVAPRLAVLDAPRRRRRKRSTAGKPPPGDSA
ncbi:MAG TPA: MarR family winged helix-turn-helix transcriptional regulator [Steroidobacteraceae bacterium]|jgi:DNA-binding MarR family transcriptional regulator|nr:MarR family winged helix-turn-helix transcriptional regulator [Steroidobacteraceae bacterium]